MNKNNDSGDPVQQLEDNFNNWIDVSFIFFISGVALDRFGKYGHLTSTLAFIIVLYFLGITILEYLTQRNKLIDKGYEIPARLDLFLFGMIAAAIFVIWLIVAVIEEKN